MIPTALKTDRPTVWKTPCTNAPWISAKVSSSTSFLVFCSTLMSRHERATECIQPAPSSERADLKDHTSSRIEPHRGRPSGGKSPMINLLSMGSCAILVATSVIPCAMQGEPESPMDQAQKQGNFITPPTAIGGRQRQRPHDASKERTWK